MALKKLLIMAGGTGGHIFPALSLARLAREKGIDVHWFGSMVGMEKDIVGDEFPMTLLPIQALRGKGLLATLATPFRLLKATMQARRVINAFHPDVVVSMGGFVSGPGGLAARLTKKPLVIHEQNAIAGMTNRQLAKFATTILSAFPNAFAEQVAVDVIGNPVRKELCDLSISPQKAADPLHVLVMGGSRGAHALNAVVPKAVARLDNKPNMEVWVQTGQQDQAWVAQQASSLPVPMKVTAFINDMKSAYQWADVVICRAGALTVSELAMVGVASLLVPFPYAVDDHQFYNAQFLQKAGAALVIRQDQLTPERLATELDALLSNREKVAEMALSARQIAMPHADVALLTACECAASARK